MTFLPHKYPTSFPTDEMRDIIAFMRGGQHEGDMKRAVKSAVVFTEWGIGLTVGEPDDASNPFVAAGGQVMVAAGCPTHVDSVDDFCDCLDAICRYAESASAPAIAPSGAAALPPFVLQALISMALQFLQNWLAKNQQASGGATARQTT